MLKKAFSCEEIRTDHVLKGKLYLPEPLIPIDKYFEVKTGEDSIDYVIYTCRCREATVRHLREILKKVSNKSFPDFSKDTSSISFKTMCKKESLKLEDLSLMVREFACLPLSKIYGEEVFNVEIETGISEFKTKPYGCSVQTEKTDSVSVKFSNLINSSPASLSFWLCGVRKAVAICSNEFSWGKDTYKNTIELVRERSGSFNKMEDIYRSLHCISRDPFYRARTLNIRGNKMSLIPYFFALEFFKFLINKKDFGPFQPWTWNSCEDYSYGYRMSMGTFFKKQSKEFKLEFLDYVLDNLEENGLEKYEESIKDVKRLIKPEV